MKTKASDSNLTESFLIPLLFSFLFYRPVVQNLMMSWAVMGRPETVSAIISDVTKEKLFFEMETKHWRTGKKELFKDAYEFTSSPTNPEELESELHTLRTASKLAIWPVGPIPFISIFLWLFLIAGMVGKYKQGSPYFNFLKALASYVFSPDNAKIALGVLAGTHLLEAFYVGYILQPLRLGTVGTLSWMSLSFLLGYPVTEKARYLSYYWKKHGKKEEDIKNK